jgi:hypothetical protein
MAFAAKAAVSDRDVSHAYLYLLGRLLVLRQEHLDFEKEGFSWNELIHREPGDVPWANPNLDVAYSEAWVAVDEDSCTLIEIPAISDRYYTVQVLNLWGETTANLNERNYPNHPSGPFALCLRGAPAPVPAGAQRIDLPGRKARVRIRIELGVDPHEATALQRRITMRATGNPRIDTPAALHLFTNDRLPGVEVFDNAIAVLATEPDINPGTAALRAKVNAVADAVAGNVDEHTRIDGVIRRQAWPALKQEEFEIGVFGNGWVHPRAAGNYGKDWLMRTAANLTGIWSNNQHEIAYFGSGNKRLLDGSATYTATFPGNDLPSSHVKYFWSVTCVDNVDHRVIPNPRNRFVLNNRARLEYASDGSLTLYFAPQKPTEAPDGNWLPTPVGKNYALTWRSYGPDQATVSGKWFPAELRKQ